MMRRYKRRNVDLQAEAEAAARKTSKDLYDLVATRRGWNFADNDEDTIESTTYKSHHAVGQPSTPIRNDPLHQAIKRGTAQGINADVDTYVEPKYSPCLKTPPRPKSRNAGSYEASDQSTVHWENVSPRRTKKKDERRRNSVNKSVESSRKREFKAVQRGWICCCCGTLFASKEQGSAHEFACLRNRFKIARTRSSSVSVVKQADSFHAPMNGAVDLSLQMQACIVMTDESLLQAVQELSPVILSSKEIDAEYELLLKAKDKAYYDLVAILSNEETSINVLPRISEGRSGLLSTIQKKLSHAYSLIKEGDDHEEQHADVYRSRRINDVKLVKLDSRTLYININVKHSLTFLNDEIERISTERWRHLRERKDFEDHFQRLRALAQIQAIR